MKMKRLVSMDIKLLSNGIADNITNELSKSAKVNSDFFILIFKQLKYN
jgi:hypothetical protein